MKTYLISYKLKKKNGNLNGRIYQLMVNESSSIQAVKYVPKDSIIHQVKRVA